MKYEKIAKGIFIERPNRFVAYVEIEGKVQKVHVPNTGRCREIFLPGSKVYLSDHRGEAGGRKTDFSLVAVEKKRKGDPKRLLINIDSTAPNKVAGEGLASGEIQLPGMAGLVDIKREKTYKKSRFDFFVKDEKGAEAFVEVKGVTLENEGIASFPDAPTERGLKHVLELRDAAENGFRAYILFIIQMEGMKWFSPNDITHKAFGDGLRECENVIKTAWDCKVTGDSLRVGRRVDIKL